MTAILVISRDLSAEMYTGKKRCKVMAVEVGCENAEC